MAGGGGGEANNDNPCPMNVVPLIDIIFCLLLFFMCSFHFKQLEGKMEAWLPLDKGQNKPTSPTQPPLGEVRIVLEFDKARNQVVRKFGRSEYPDDQELAQVMKEQFDRKVANGEGEVPVIIQPDPNVSWDSVVRVMDLVRQKELPKMEFSFAKSEFVIPDK